MTRHLVPCLFLGCLIASALTAQDSPTIETAPDPTTPTTSPAGSAMSTLFSPARAPKRKTMGLLQRSFLDLADQGDQELEVAIVVDGTDSMTSELAGVRQSIHQMLADLRRYRNNDVRAAIVVYRDAGSPSGEIVIPSKQFTADDELIAKAVEALSPESGAPFFHELPDLGIHAAITELEWSDDASISKWILMFGDAPPYAAAFKDPKNKAFRRFDTPLLVALAKSKNIRVNCVLCTSNQNVSRSYDTAINQTRTFFGALAQGTDGLMLDMSYPEIRTAMIDAGKQPDVALAAIQPIAAIDLAAVRRDNLAASPHSDPVRIAVLPHLPLNQMTFDASNQAVQVSTALRSQLASVAGVQVASPRDIKSQLRRLRAEGLSDTQAIRGLSSRLGVDYVVWGSLASDQATFQTTTYHRDNGQHAIPIRLAKNGGDVAYALVKASSAQAPDDVALAQLVSRMTAQKSALTAPMSKDAATNSHLLRALESLDQALQYESGSEDSVQLLQEADLASQNAINADKKNAIAHWLQSNVAYNQASRLFQTGQRDAASKRMDQMRSSLGRAMQFRESIANPSLITEIEADYYLLESREPDKAAQQYLKMTADDQPLATQLRGHWMLAGLYAGDWGNAQLPIVDPAKAREHVVQIMANWPDSPEAELLKTWLRWDDTQEKTDFNFLPQVNAGLVGA
ncbi:hypothetical protein K227x_28930 [Rubripirellula lacrimiformis]|uniref:VWFA domain-containing protein n=1 Tax=Rubripirellula lacrimiformis TaxID=1930273 RepID=A0A517NBI5_9BACT|nr:vWA domain-containing protein [Rubripirellula lacrimiformis]QDT04501.1 hypothetical protein K227x_28930 [Rubripirellula lacrimiformis]